MTQSLSDIVLHIVFSTKNRHPFISQSIEEELYRYIAGVAFSLGCPTIKINGMNDHIHILLQMNRTVAASELVSRLKSSSSRWLKSKGSEYQDFSWQSGFAVFSVSRPSLECAIRYVSNQKEHHKIVSFKDEFIQMLKRAQIEYNENYLWN